MNETTYDSQLFAELYDVQPQAIVWLRPIWNHDRSDIIDFEFTYCNEEGLKFLKLTRAQQKGLRLSVSPTVTDELRAQFMEEMKQVYYSGKPSKTDIYNPALNKYARVLRTRLRDGILTVVQDRTEENRTIHRLEEQTRLLAQQTAELKHQKKLLDNVMKYSPAGISVTEVIRNEEGTIVDGRTILANDLGITFTGINKDTALTKTISETDPDMLKSPLFQMARNTLETGQPFHTQYFLAPTGRWLELSVAKMDENHLINIFTDITSTKTTQLQLQKAADRITSVFNASQSGMFTFSPVWNDNNEIVDFRFGLSNPALASYIGHTPGELQGQLGSAFFPGYLHNGLFDMYKTTFLTGEPQRKEIHYNVDGHDLHLDLMSTKVDDELLVTFTDYTELKKSQFQLEKLVEDLKRSNAYLEEFAHVASHDLKEPIRKIHTFSDRLKMSLTDRMTEHEAAIFSRMQNATERMMQLMDDLLSYSHLSLKPREKEEIDLNHKLKLVLTDLEVLIEEKKADIQIAPLPVVYGYRRQLQQLFQNLLSNALKYSKAGVQPVIRIESKKITGADAPVDLPAEMCDNWYHLITVADNGIGFEQEYAERIFGMFQRLHGRSEYAGTGVGLSIARKVAENHNGYIWAEGVAGKGATFYVLLPA